VFTKQYQLFKAWISTPNLTIYLLAGIVLLLGGVLSGCNAAASTPVSEPDPVEQPQTNYADKKILWVDSYHEGYEWSDGIEAGIREVLQATGVELKVVRLDTNRNSGDEFGQKAALQAKAEIEAFKPDVLIASDDSAQEYLIVPYYKDTELPVVFAGVNWDASGYGYPASNVTGMIEVDFVTQMVDNLDDYAQGNRIGYLSGDRNTDRKLAEVYNERFFEGQMKTYFVKSYDEFEETFLKAQEEVDILYFGNNAGIEGWDEETDIEFITANTKIPTGSRNDWMAPYVLVTLAKSGEEQGEWAANTALSILDGTSVSDIPVAENKKSELILNLDIAEQLEVVFPPSLLRNAEVYASKGR
jgi:ABC-type uncharacterized transport system substrate-binding protein